MCPSGCEKDKAEVYGNTKYTKSSAVCKAALHTGKLPSKEFNLVEIKIHGGKIDIQEGVKRNGVTSKNPLKQDINSGYFEFVETNIINLCPNLANKEKSNYKNFMQTGEKLI